MSIQQNVQQNVIEHVERMLRASVGKSLLDTYKAAYVRSVSVSSEVGELSVISFEVVATPGRREPSNGEWIDVGSSLPDSDDPVLTCGSQDWARIAVCDESGTFVDAGTYKKLSPQPTHWATIPQLPADGDQR